MAASLCQLQSCVRKQPLLPHLPVIAAAGTSEQARNRSIGFDVLYSNSTSQDGVNQAPIDSDSGDNNVTDSNESTGIVQVQDETNMPNQNWDDNLNDKKDNTATKEYECPTSVPPCNKKNLTATTAPIVPDESGFSTTLAAATNSTDAGLCPLSVTSLECIKLMSLHVLPALLSFGNRRRKHRGRGTDRAARW